MKKVLITTIILLSVACVFAQQDISAIGGLNLWRYKHNQSENLSQNVSMSYTIGAQYERVVWDKGLTVLGALKYTLAPPGNSLRDLSGGSFANAVAYEQELNNKYVEVVHHQFSIPIMCLYYNGIVHAGAGLQYNRILFPHPKIDEYFSVNDIGLRLQTGIKINKKISVDVAYYKGFKDVIKFYGIIYELNSGLDFYSKMQGIEIYVTYSLWGDFPDIKF